MRRLAAAARWPFVLAGLALASPSLGEPRHEPVHLAYEAPAECPVQQTLEAAIRDRTAAARFTSSQEARRVFAVTVTATGRGYHGSVAVVTDGTSSSRDLAAPRCDDLVAALSLVIALAIDPPADPIASVAAPPVAAARSPWSLAGVAGGAVTAGIAPGATAGAALEGRVAWRGLGHLGVGALFGWDAAEMETGDVRFTWLAARASACGRWLSTAIESDICAHAELGGLRVRARDIVNAQEQDRLWMAPGAHASARWPASSRVFAELQVGVSFPLTRDHYYFDHGGSIHETWAATPWLALSAGVRSSIHGAGSK